jgi:hypothetical protein
LALIAGSNPMICAECKRREEDKSILDLHHVAGKSNHDLAIPIPVNDHRALLSEDMYDWPRETLENPSRSPLLAAAACIRGFCTTVLYLIDRLLYWIADLFERLHLMLTERLGEGYWADWDLHNKTSRKGN